MDGWVLSRYADLTAAFHSPDLLLVGPASKEKSPSVDEPARLRMRAETREALSPVALRSWRKHMLHHARELVAQFDCGHPIGLIKDYAEPLCFALAIPATHPDPVPGQHLAELAAQVSLAAAEPLDDRLRSQSEDRDREAAPFLHYPARSRCRTLGFVALSRTLVSLLGNAWFALGTPSAGMEAVAHAARPGGARRRGTAAVCGLTRPLFRRAVVDTTLNGLSIRNGDRVILCLLAANRDPERYPDPHQLSVMRPRISHVSLGAGLHACVGAPLVRHSHRCGHVSLG